MSSHIRSKHAAARPRRRTIRFVLTAALSVLSVPALVSPAQAALAGGFELDGNQVVDGSGLDWKSSGLGVDVIHDQVGTSDTTIFSGGDQENNYPNWSIGSTSPSGKSDIGNVLIADYKYGGDTWLAFAWDRAKDQQNGSDGTGRYYIELNQDAYSSSTALVPTRTVGDVRIVISAAGNDALACAEIDAWDGSVWKAKTNGCDGVNFAVNATTITDNFGSANGPDLAPNTFAESVIDMSALGLTTCPVTGFKSLHMRSQEGNASGETGKLKDFAAGPITVASDCGSITINKTVDGTDPGNATFMISPDPTPGSSASSLVVHTGSDGTVTQTATPGVTYTIQELAPPTGYLLPASDTQTVTVGKSENKSVSFDDVQGTLKFTKTYQGKNPTGTGASFDVTRTDKWSYDTDPAGGIDNPSLVSASGPTIHVTDNGTNDADSTMGKIEVDGLAGGTYTITETGAPDGWKVDPNNTTQTFTIGATDANATATKNSSDDPITFNNKLRPIAIKVVKTQSVPGVPADTTFLPGVTFKLYNDTDGKFADATLVGSAVTDANGEITWSGLDWQHDYWLQEVKKAGYKIGLDPNPTLINVDQSNPPTNDNTVITVPVDNPREEFSITLTKVDDSDPAVKLSGGSFQLWREADNLPGLTAGDVMLASEPATNGEVTFSQNDLNIPWGYTYYVYEASAPTGYQLMTPNPIVVDGTSSDVANTTVDLGNVVDPKKPVHLTLVKVVDNGTTDGTATVSDFPLTASGPDTVTGVSGTSDVTDQLVQAGTYTLSESNPNGVTGYTASKWSCVGTQGEGNDGSNGSVTLALGDNVTCTITNTAQPGTYTYSKSSDPVSGSTVQPGDTVTYTVTVTKTGGVDSTNVVINDDLSNVLNNATLVPGSLTYSTGSASIVADKLTWTIGTLSGTETVTYQVKVNDGAWGVTLHNVVTSTGGSCEGTCETTHVTPHWTLYKTSDPATGSTVMPGKTVAYSLTAHNDSNGVVTGATVTDNLSDVFDNATYVDGSLSGDGSFQIVGNTLSWTLPTLQPGDTVHLQYSVTVNAGQWGQTLDNVATPDEPSGNCVAPGCETTDKVPPVTTLVVQKVDSETGTPLAGATFQLWTDNPPYFNADGIAGNADDVIGPEDTTFGDPVVTDAAGLAKWADLFKGGHYIVQETAAPAGYGMPATSLMGVVLSDSSFVPGGEMAPLQFADPAQGQIAILSKKEFHDVSANNASGDWQPITGEVPFGERIKYVITVKATGNKLFHNVTVTDYVPGYNPVDTTTTNKATYEAGSAACTGFTCTTHFDPATGEVTWYIGDVQGATGTVSFVVNFPQLPNPVPYDANETYKATIWNEAFLDWDELDTTSSSGGATTLLAQKMLHYRMTSNQVTATAKVVALPEQVLLPNTGATVSVEVGGLVGSALVGLGAWLMAVAIRRRRAMG